MKLIKNNSIKYGNGTEHYSLSYGSFLIVSKVDKKNTQGRYVYYLIEFKDGSRSIVDHNAIRCGRVKNPNISIMSGVTVTHCNPNSKAINRKHYQLWKDMIRRCYDPKYIKRNPTYNDITVCEEWRDFKKFSSDIQELKNYSLWITGKYNMEIDKDIKIKGNKVYSKDTCMFVTHAMNTVESNLTGKRYKAFCIETKEVKYFYNQIQFCRDFGFNRARLWACLSGKAKSHKGWTFEIDNQ